MQKRGQVSVEYVVTVGFAVLLIIPLTVILYEHSTSTYDDVSNNQAGVIARKIADTANNVYFLGHPSTITFKAYVPDDVDFINFTNREIIMQLKSGREVVSVADINFTEKIIYGSGVQYIRVSALPTEVNVSYGG